MQSVSSSECRKKAAARFRNLRHDLATRIGGASLYRRQRTPCLAQLRYTPRVRSWRPPAELRRRVLYRSLLRVLSFRNHQHGAFEYSYAIDPQPFTCDERPKLFMLPPRRARASAVGWKVLVTLGGLQVAEAKVNIAWSAEFGLWSRRLGRPVAFTLPFPGLFQHTDRAR
jgi:hypothetical protein